MYLFNDTSFQKLTNYCSDLAYKMCWSKVTERYWFYQISL